MEKELELSILDFLGWDIKAGEYLLDYPGESNKVFKLLLGNK